MKKNKREVLLCIVTVLCCLAAMTVIVVVALLIYDKVGKKSADEQEAVEAFAELEEIVTYSQEEVDLMLADAVAETENSTREQVTADILAQIRNSYADGNSTVATLRPLFRDEIVVVSNGQFHFVPIRDDLKHHSLLQENLNVLENGELQYMENGEVVSHKGIDVSKYQGSIDWEKVAADGVEYAFIRVIVRGYGSAGRLVYDDRYEENIRGALSAGIKVGVYVFSQAITEEEAIEEAETLIAAIEGYDITYPIVYDVEKTGAADGRMNQLSVEERTRMAHIFIDRIRDAGYTPMIYSNMEMWSVLINMDEFEDVEKWFAYYSPDLYFPYEYAVWQYSDTGNVNGISTAVDLNISFKEW